MRYFRASHVTGQLASLREKGHPRGEYTGFKPLDHIFTVKKGYPLFIAGLPHSGKTELALELQLNLSVLYGWTHFDYLGETGAVEDIISELCHKLVSKPYRKGHFAMDDAERLFAEEFVNRHFVFLDPEQDFSIEEFYTACDSAEAEHGFKFSTTLIDPVNDVREDLSAYGGREDKWLKHELKRVRINAKKHDRVNILVNHVADIKPIYDSGSGKQYTPMPMPSQWAGGRTWHRRAFTMLCIYRPPTFLNDETGQPYAENQTLIVNQKAKPKGTGKLGSASLFWDWKANRYYWTYGGMEQFAFAITPELNFSTEGVRESETENLPF